MTTNRGLKLSFIAQSDFGPVLGRGDPDSRGFASTDVWASIETSPEQHEFMLGRLPRLAMLQGVNQENAVEMLRVSTDRRLSLLKTLSRISQSE